MLIWKETNEHFSNHKNLRGGPIPRSLRASIIGPGREPAEVLSSRLAASHSSERKTPYHGHYRTRSELGGLASHPQSEIHQAPQELRSASTLREPAEVAAAQTRHHDVSITNPRALMTSIGARVGYLRAGGRSRISWCKDRAVASLLTATQSSRYLARSNAS